MLLCGGCNDYPSWINGNSRREEPSPSEALRLPRNPGECDKLSVPHCWVGLDWGNPTGQQGSPAVTLSHKRDGLSVRVMAVWCPFRRPSMCRPVHRAFLRSAWLDLTTIAPATP